MEEIGQGIGMDPVQKALWYLESHLREAMTLEGIAKVCQVSSFHLTRAFAATTGLSLMRYVRARRMTEAARLLANGCRDILAIALDLGYGSHEAFTRAFREQFGITPEQLRARGDCDSLTLLEALTMDSTPTPALAPPRFETLGPVLFAGLVERYDCQSSAGIPNQWQQFSRYLGNIDGQKGSVAYGVCYHFDADGYFDYMCGVEVADESRLSDGLKSLQIAPNRYVVFTHSGHVAGIRGTISAIWSTWFPRSGHQPDNAPNFERYGPEFNPRTGMGGFEIWIPIKE